MSALSRGTRGAGPRWDSGTTEQLLHFLKSPSDRSWRFLETTGLLDAALPELMDAFRRRPLDLYALENNGIIRWSTLGRVAQMRLVDRSDHQFDVRSLDAARTLVYPHLVSLAALLIDATRDLDRPASVAEPILDRLVLSETDRRIVGRLVSDQHLLRSAALRRDGLYEDSVLRIAAHLGTPEEAHAQYVLSVAMNGLEVWEVDLLSELHSLIVESLSSPSMLEMGGSNVVDRFDLTDREGHKLTDARKPQFEARSVMEWLHVLFVVESVGRPHRSVGFVSVPNVTSRNQLSYDYSAPRFESRQRSYPKVASHSSPSGF